MRPLRDIALLLLTAGSAGFAQTYTAAKIVYNHPGLYSQAQLEEATGMHVGSTFNAEDFGAAAQRLVDSGFFENVGATLSGSLSQSNVLFDITPIDRSHMVHVGFENFVWLSHAEVEDALRRKSPLFLDYLPEGSPLLDEFNTALTEALAAKGVTAKVAHDTVEPTLLRPERTIDFMIVSPDIRVANVKLAGVTADLTPLLQKSVNAAARAPYSEGISSETTEDRILQPLLNAGYVQARLSGTAITPTLVGDKATVVVSATLRPGAVYRVSEVTFAGSPLLSAEAFSATEKLHPGDVASRDLLMQTLAPLDAAYRQQGYMDVLVKAAPVMDEANLKVAYAVTVEPGEQYRVHEVTANNLDTAAKADFDRGFLMKPGDLYNPDYVATFLKKNSALQNLAGYSGSFKAFADPNTHTVDVVMTFYRSEAR